MNSLKLILFKQKYFSVTWVFASLNIMIGTWVLYIPYVKEKLKLSDSEIGFALFCLALGILVFLPVVPYIIKKMGLGKYTIIGITLFAIAFIGPVVALNYTSLCLSLFVVGIFSGSTDVAMNTLVSEIEKQDDNNFMSSAHGFFSLGGVIGAVLGSILMPFFSSPIYHMLGMASCVVAINLWLAKHYTPIKESNISKEKKPFRLSAFKPLLVIAFLAFVIMMSEGAIENWSTLYLLEVVEISQKNLSGLGFILFSITMTLGRFFGDGISNKMGSGGIILLGCLIASIGYLAVLYNQLTVTVFGFGLIGLGLSVIIPELFRIAGKTPGVLASSAISFVSGIGFMGFLIGPVALGFVSDIHSLKMSFLVLFILTVFALVTSLFKLKKKPLSA